MTDPTDQIAALRERARECLVQVGLGDHAILAVSQTVRAMLAFARQEAAALAPPHPVGDRESIARGPEADDTFAIVSAEVCPSGFEPVLDDDRNPTGYHREIASGQIVTLGDEFDDEELDTPIALSPTAAVPEGFVMVPREPTEAMVEAGTDYRPIDARTRARECYIAMLAATPTPENKS